MHDDAPKKEKRPRPSRFQAAALPPGSAATSRPATAATSRPAVSAWRALAGSASAGGLKHPSVRSCQSAGPVCGSTSATTAAATDAPAARTAPLATGASNLVRALAAKRMVEPYGLRRARPASLVLSPAVPGARASAGSHHQQAPDRRFWPREYAVLSERGMLQLAPGGASEFRHRSAWVHAVDVHNLVARLPFFGMHWELKLFRAWAQLGRVKRYERMRAQLADTHILAHHRATAVVLRLQALACDAVDDARDARLVMLAPPSLSVLADGAAAIPTSDQASGGVVVSAALGDEKRPEEEGTTVAVKPPSRPHGQDRRRRAGSDGALFAASLEALKASTAVGSVEAVSVEQFEDLQGAHCRALAARVLSLMSGVAAELQHQWPEFDAPVKFDSPATIATKPTAVARLAAAGLPINAKRADLLRPADEDASAGTAPLCPPVAARSHEERRQTPGFLGEAAVFAAASGRKSTPTATPGAKKGKGGGTAPGDRVTSEAVAALLAAKRLEALGLEERRREERVMRCAHRESSPPPLLADLTDALPLSGASFVCAS